MRGAPAWAVLILGALSIGTGRLFGLMELYIIGSGLMLCVLAGFIHIRTRSVHMDIQRNIEPAYPMSGTEVLVSLTLHSLRRTPACDLIDLVNETSRVSLTLTPLARNRSTRVRYRVPTKRRGVLTLGPSLVEVSDPLGLLSRRRRIGISTDVVVHPHWVSIDLPDPQACQGTLIDLIRRLIGQMSVNLEFRSLREYVSGDDLRRINWKSSARRDVLILNEYEARAPLVIHVSLDVDQAAYSLNGFERAVSIAASFVGAAGAARAETDPRVHLSCSPHFDAAIDESTHLEAMRCLAEVDIDTNSTPAARLNDPGEFRVNVIVCGNRDSNWLDSADRFMGTGHATVVIFCETPTGSTFDHDHWIAVTCADIDEFADLWSALSRRTTSG